MSIGVQIFIEHIGTRESWNGSHTNDIYYTIYTSSVCVSVSVYGVKRSSKYDPKKAPFTAPHFRIEINNIAQHSSGTGVRWCGGGSVCRFTCVGGEKGIAKL